MQEGSIDTKHGLSVGKTVSTGEAEESERERERASERETEREKRREERRGEREVLLIITK